jgi:hypothetical protein
MQKHFCAAMLLILAFVVYARGQQSKSVDQSSANPPGNQFNVQWSPGAIPYGAANMTIDIFPAVTGKPFHAQVNARKIETKPDGKQITYESHGILARDSDGRVLQGGLASPQVAVADGTTSTLFTAKVTDPTSKFEYRWDEFSKTVEKMRPLPHQIRSTPEPLDACEREEGKTRTYPTGITQQIESLGERTIQGVPTRGCRVTTLLPAHQTKENQPRTVTDDSWCATELGVCLLTIHHDPNHEDETVELDNLVLSEPDLAMFKAPADYKLHDPEQEELQREQSQPALTNPQLLAGMWETESNGIIDGFDLVLSTRSRDAKEYLSTIHLRIHHIEKGEEKWGWYKLNEDKIGTWDGTRLRLDHDPPTADLASLHVDLVFDPVKQEFRGDFKRNGVSRQVVLRRPGALANQSPNPLTGDWYLHSDRSRPVPPGAFYQDFCLHLAQRQDGSFTAWTDNKMGGQGQYGTRLKVLNAIGNTVEVQSDNAGGNTVTITGSVSDDGQTIDAKWLTNGNSAGPPRVLIKTSREGFSQNVLKP